MKRRVEPETVRYCRDCAEAEFDYKFCNLSLEGKPTLLSCPESRPWKRVVTERACAKFKERL